MSLAIWVRWLAWLAAETTVLVAGAAVLHLWLRSPRAGRTIWRAALAAVALVWMVELSGLRERMAVTPVMHQHFIITATVLPVNTPAWQRHPAAEPKNSGETPLSPWPLWPLWIWLTGSSLLLTRFCLARVWLARRRRAATPADADSLGRIGRWQAAFGLRRVQSQVWAGLRGPVAFGVLRPTVALPSDFTARFSCAEREAMLAHEMAHLAAHDPFWWMVSDAVVALAWWHPLVWWARRQLQSAHEAAADEASALIPGGAQTLAECLLRLGRELTAPGPARALGVGGNGPRSQLAARIERLLRDPRGWRPMSLWARWIPQVSAMLVALTSALLPIQTGLSGSILAVLASAAPARAEVQPSPPMSLTNYALAAAPLPARLLSPATNQAKSSTSGGSSQTKPAGVVSDLARLSPPVAPTNPLPKVTLLFRLVSLQEKGPGDIGLDWLFGVAPTNNPALEKNHDWIVGLGPVDISGFRTNVDGIAWPTSPSVHPDNLVIDHLLTEGQTAVLKPAQFAALLEQIEKQTDADIMAVPSITTYSGRQAYLACQNLMTCVTGARMTNNSADKGPSVNYIAEGVALGNAVNVLPKLEDDGQWRLQVLASYTLFIGYDDPGKGGSFSGPGGKPIEYVTPLPHFRALQAAAEETVVLGQTLAMRGPLWTETNKIKGHFLVPTKTKTVRHRLYLFVTPTLPEVK